MDGVMAIIQNSGAVVGILVAIGFIIMLCVKPLREKFIEYIILKHETEEEQSKIDELKAVIDAQSD